MSSLGDGGRAAEIVTAEGCIVVLGPGVPPQREAEADEGDADRNGEQPLGELRQLRGGDGRDGANGEEHRGPTGKDVGPEEGDAEDDAADNVGEAAPDEDLHRADIADRGAAVGHREHVVDIARLSDSKGREDEHTDDLDAEDGEVADAEYDVPDQAEQSDLSDLTQVGTGDAD